MDLITMIQKINELVGDIRSGDYLAAFKVAFELAAEIIKNLPKQAHHGAMPSSKSLEELASDLDACCRMESASPMATAAPTGPFIVVVWPILKALLLQLIPLLP